MPDASKVTTGKPKVGGAIFRAPEGTTLPTDATSALAAAFTELGYASEDGLTNGRAAGDEIKAWGGDVVYSSMEDTFSIKLIEAQNVDTLKVVHGDSNVTGTLAEGIAITVNEDDKGTYAWVFDMILRGGSLKRVVIPRAKVTKVGDIIYKDDDVVAYEITLKASPDAAGNYHYEYIKAASNG